MGVFSSNADSTNEQRGVAAFEVLVREHHRNLLAYARALTKQDSVAEDLVQEAFVVAWKKFGEFDTSKDFSAWLRGITRFKYLHWARKKREDVLAPEDIEMIEAMHEEWDLAWEQGSDLLEIARECTDELPDRPAGLIKSFYHLGMTTPEIAKIDEQEVPTIRKRLQRAREMIAECIERKLKMICGI